MLYLHKKAMMILMVIAAVLLSAVPSIAQEYQPITSIDLGVDTLTLEVGESYTFEVSYVPEEPSFYSLSWHTTDDSIISIDRPNFTITALQPGEVSILAESFDGVSYDTCKVIVNGNVSKDAYEMKSGNEFMNLSEADRQKITARSIVRYLNFIENVSFSQSTYSTAAQRIFMVSADVVPGTEESESQRAIALGMEDVNPLFNIHAVTLRGTLEQILAFVQDNPDLKAIFEFDIMFISDPVTEEFDDSTAKAMNLQGNVENLIQVSKAHNLGYKGSGTTVAIIDTGLNPSHEQFSGRVIGQRCFSGTFTDDEGYNWYSPCASTTSASPSNARTKSEFYHGSHVAGIAAGRDGIAPDAKIVAVQAFTEKIWTCANTAEANSYACSDYASTGKCCRAMTWSNHQEQAYDYLVGLANSGTKIAAVNMSYGGGENPSACDNYYQYTYFQNMIDAGMVPVVSSGNDSYNSAVGSPGCLSNAFTVGALADLSTPKLADYSNHSSVVDITAPGTNLYSAYYPSGYGLMSGTSMAAPVVTGSIALVRQAYPYNSVAAMENFLLKSTSKTVNTRESGYNFSYTKPVLNFTNFADTLLETLNLSISQNDVQGFDKGISINVNRDTKADGYYITVYDIANKKTISPTITISHTNTVSTIKLTGSGLVNGNLYKLTIYKYHMVGEYRYKSKTVTVYGMPNTVTNRVTAVPNNNAVKLNSEYKSGMDGVRYFVYDASTNIQVANATLTGTNTVTTISGLTNGKLYYVYARPYRLYNGEIVKGPKGNLVYFVPVAPSSGSTVYFSDPTTAVVSTTANSTATGVRVLYREAGGSLKNGCEAANNKCSIANLSNNTAYEFYIMRYNLVNGKKHYGSGASIQYYAPALSPLGVPANAKISATNTIWTFYITKASDATGISVLYRINEGSFSLACEKEGTSCTANLDVDKAYTFYIMQYKVINGKKVYSAGITVKNMYGTKSVDGDDLVTEFVEVSEEMKVSELYNAIDGYMTEEDLLNQEALELVSVEQAYEYPELTDIDFNQLEAEVETDEIPAELMAMNYEVDDFEPTEADFIDVPTNERPLEALFAEDPDYIVNGNVSTDLKGFETSAADEEVVGFGFYMVDDGVVSDPYVPSFRTK